MTPLDLTPASPLLAPPSSKPAVESALVFAPGDIRVNQGVNRGDALGGPDEVLPDDVYRLARDAVLRRLVVRHCANVGRQVDVATEIGTPGAPATPIAHYHLMARTGERVELVLLDLGAQRAVLPLAPLAPKTGYVLLATDPHPRAPRLAEHLNLWLAAGTMITLGEGTQRPVEALAPGEAVLTRDHGRQPLRWLGHVRLRATGVFAPVVVTAGTLGNGGELILGQNQRLFVPRRRPGNPPCGIPTEARTLVDGDCIHLRESGWTDCYSLVFAAHEIVFAEGVPTESLRFSREVLGRLPPGLATDLPARFPALDQPAHFGTASTASEEQPAIPSAPPDSATIPALAMP